MLLQILLIVNVIMIAMEISNGVFAKNEVQFHKEESIEDKIFQLEQNVVKLDGIIDQIIKSEKL